MKLTRHDTNKNLVRQKGREGRDFKVKFNALEPGHWNGKKDIGEDGSGTILSWKWTSTRGSSHEIQVGVDITK